MPRHNNTRCRGLPFPQEDFRPLVKAAQGFEYRPERPNATGIADQKWGWRGLQPGACTARGACKHQCVQRASCRRAPARPAASHYSSLRSAAAHAPCRPAGDWALLEVNTRIDAASTQQNATICEWCPGPGRAGRKHQHSRHSAVAATLHS